MKNFPAGGGGWKIVAYIVMLDLYPTGSGVDPPFPPIAYACSTY